ncbi:hypothetical protein WJX72_004897 [[Myrmecia] bisecta]|uniref:Uncharacterized protein n=1 Tax=[Myrmecia] bisecta TaxID=41462 RepID=A0AAW1P8M2_9CHLO
MRDWLDQAAGVALPYDISTSWRPQVSPRHSAEHVFTGPVLRTAAWSLSQLGTVSLLGYDITFSRRTAPRKRAAVGRNKYGAWAPLQDRRFAHKQCKVLAASHDLWETSKQRVQDAGHELKQMVAVEPPTRWVTMPPLLAFIKRRRQQVAQRKQTLAVNARSLAQQQNRFKRALGGEVDASDNGATLSLDDERRAQQDSDLLTPADPPAWRDPMDWDPETRKQWESFMTKSKSLQIGQEQWWDIDNVDDNPPPPRVNTDRDGNRI